ncbi:sensor histidine kinase [Spirosoma linguale]|uniref:histidine kinase n=1 Tax=Spirosoma linguale (strain ATCC 33905 / DSM 74 / LMG 10896 / Claus 1) TaxID=504472 RepID=D2QI84_SPILD|nr:histidine kinase [Spirosoma linguale DSM 74]
MLIRNKLTLVFTSLALAIQLTFSVFIYAFYSVYRQQEFYSQLQAKARVYGRVLIGRQDVTHLLDARVPASDLITLTSEQVSIYDSRLSLLFDNKYAEYDQQEQKLLPQLRQVSQAPDGKRLTQVPIQHFTIGQVEGIGTTFAHRGQTYFIFVAGLDQLGRSKRYNLLIILLIGNLGGLMLILLAGWYFAGRFLQPLSALTQTVRHISEAHLHTRLHEGNRRDEIAQLAITFNAMLEQLERSFESQRQFVAHASHELRTPLTNLLGTLDTSLTYDREVEAYRLSMESAIDEVRKVIHLTNSLLSLAKIGSEQLAPVAVRLDTCLLEAVTQVQRKYPERAIELTFDDGLDGFFFVKGTAPLLTTALANVIDNACKYSQAPVQVILQQVRNETETYEVRVIDHGRGIAPADRPHVFKPLVRGSNVGQINGFGIGLAIAQQIIQLHHGQITLEPTHVENDAAGHAGTTVTIQLPAAEEDNAPLTV